MMVALVCVSGGCLPYLQVPYVGEAVFEFVSFGRLKL